MRTRSHRRSSQRKKTLRFLYSLVVFLALFWYAKDRDLIDPLPAQLTNQPTEVSSAFSQIDPQQLAVYFLDVGQGDSTLIKIPDGDDTFTMLIDTGEYEYADGLTDTLTELGVERIDALVCSHQHTDHMGCMARIVQRFEIGNLYLPELPAERVPTTSAYLALLEAADEKDLTLNALYRGAQIDCPQSVTLEVLSPEADADWDDLNNFSAVLRLTYGNTTFLFTGDAEKASEAILLQTAADLSADVLKCGHHGSKTSTSVDFLSAVSPATAIISCGLDNSYGHPHEETLTKLSEFSVNILQTAEDGTILALSDGETIRFTTGLPCVPSKYS